MKGKLIIVILFAVIFLLLSNFIFVMSPIFLIPILAILAFLLVKEKNFTKKTRKIITVILSAIAVILALLFIAVVSNVGIG